MVRIGRRYFGATAVSAVVLLVVASRQATPQSDTNQTDASAAQLAPRALQGGRIEAHGTWRTSDGKQQGVWRLGEGLQANASGTWSAAVLVQDVVVVDSEPAPLGPRKRAQVSREARANVEGTVQGNQVVFRGAPQNANAASDAAPPSAFDHAVSSGTAQGTVKGVKLEGTFTTPDGLAGQWEGWWHLWNANPPAAVDGQVQAE